MKDFYSVLGVNDDCSFEEIKEAYRKLSKKFHPDMNQGDDYFVSRFREINEAYETLIDPDKRRRYDKNLKALNHIDEEFKKRQYNRQQAENARSQSAYSGYYRPKTKRAGAGITIVLILLGLIVAVYLVQSFGHTKKKITSSGDTVAARALSIIKPHKHHKKKHSLLNKSDSAAAANSSSEEKRAGQSPGVAEKHLAALNDQQVANENIKPLVAKPVAPVKQPITVTKANIVAGRAFPYSTYVRPNVTGVVNMRKFDDYSSVIIERIPANSKVLVLQKGEVYYKVSYESYVGFVPKWSLQAK